MEKEFVPYSIALRMKALGFDEPSFTYYSSRGSLVTGFIESAGGFNIEDLNKGTLAPLFQQAFKWFRDEYKLPSFIQSRYDKWQHKVCHRYSYGNNSSIFLGAGESVNYWEIITDYETYEEAELACIEKLLDIVEAKLKKDGNI
jgi:hypothetical protein